MLNFRPILIFSIVMTAGASVLAMDEKGAATGTADELYELGHRIDKLRVDRPEAVVFTPKFGRVGLNLTPLTPDWPLNQTPLYQTPFGSPANQTPLTSSLRSGSSAIFTSPPDLRTAFDEVASPTLARPRPLPATVYAAAAAPLFNAPSLSVMDIAVATPFAPTLPMEKTDLGLAASAKIMPGRGLKRDSYGSPIREPGDIGSDTVAGEFATETPARGLLRRSKAQFAAGSDAADVSRFASNIDDLAGLNTNLRYSFGSPERRKKQAANVLLSSIAGVNTMTDADRDWLRSPKRVKTAYAALDDPKRSDLMHKFVAVDPIGGVIIPNLSHIAERHMSDQSSESVIQKRRGQKAATQFPVDWDESKLLESLHDACLLGEKTMIESRRGGAVEEIKHQLFLAPDGTPLVGVSRDRHFLFDTIYPLAAVLDLSGDHHSGLVPTTSGAQLKFSRDKLLKMVENAHKKKVFGGAKVSDPHKFDNVERGTTFIDIAGELQCDPIVKTRYKDVIPKMGILVEVPADFLVDRTSFDRR